MSPCAIPARFSESLPSPIPVEAIIPSIDTALPDVHLLSAF